MTLPTVDHPRVEAQARRARDGVWILAIVCPYCGKTHSHGGGDAETPDYGWRVPHCLTGDHPDYELVPGADAVSPGAPVEASDAP